MSFDGNGNYTAPTGTLAVSGQVIESGKYNALVTDLQTALSKALLRDGQSAAQANISMGGFKLTGLGGASLRSDAPNFGQVQDSSARLLTSVAGTNTITASLTTPQLAAYINGLELNFVPAVTNTGAVTLNVNGLGAKAILSRGVNALNAGDLQAGGAYHLMYDGVQFQLMGSAAGGTGSGAVAGGVLYENNQTLTADYTISAGKNAMMAGPLTIADGVTLTIPTGSSLVVL